MSRTILDPQYANALNGLFDGSGSIDIADLTCTAIVTEFINSDTNLSLAADNGVVNIGGNSIGLINKTTPANSISLTMPAPNTLGVNGAIQLISGANSVSLSYAPSNVLSVIGGIKSSGSVITQNIQSDTNITVNASSGVVNIITGSIGLFSADATSSLSLACVGGAFTVSGGVGAGVTAPLYRGGLGKVIFTYALPTIFSGTAITFTEVIPNFVGNATTTAYVISSNLVNGVAPTSQSNLFTYAVSFNSTDGTDTTVNVLITNPTTLTIGTTGDSTQMSIIAMN